MQVDLSVTELTFIERKDNWVMFHHFMQLLYFVFHSFWKSLLLSLGVSRKVLWVCPQTRFQVFSKNLWRNTWAARTMWPGLSRGWSPGVPHNLSHSMILWILLKLSFKKRFQPKPAKVAAAFTVHLQRCQDLGKSSQQCKSPESKKNFTNYMLRCGDLKVYLQCLASPCLEWGWKR